LFSCGIGWNPRLIYSPRFHPTPVLRIMSDRLYLRRGDWVILVQSDRGSVDFRWPACVYHLTGGGGG
jgi:hypothetical protein